MLEGARGRTGPIKTAPAARAEPGAPLRAATDNAQSSVSCPPVPAAQGIFHQPGDGAHGACDWDGAGAGPGARACTRAGTPRPRAGRGTDHAPVPARCAEGPGTRESARARVPAVSCLRWDGGWGELLPARGFRQPNARPAAGACMHAEHARRLRTLAGHAAMPAAAPGLALPAVGMHDILALGEGVAGAGCMAGAGGGVGAWHHTWGHCFGSLVRCGEHLSERHGPCRETALAPRRRLCRLLGRAGRPGKPGVPAH